MQKRLQEPLWQPLIEVKVHLRSTSKPFLYLHSTLVSQHWVEIQVFEEFIFSAFSAAQMLMAEELGSRILIGKYLDHPTLSSLQKATQNSIEVCRGRFGPWKGGKMYRRTYMSWKIFHSSLPPSLAVFRQMASAPTDAAQHSRNLEARENLNGKLRNFWANFPENFWSTQTLNISVLICTLNFQIKFHNDWKFIDWNFQRKAL